MTLDRGDVDKDKKNDDRGAKIKKAVDNAPRKVVVRRLPPSLNRDTFLEQVSPIPDHDYFHYVKGFVSRGESVFSRAYISFLNLEDVILFQEQFDAYVFVDAQGHEYTCLVELAPFQKIPKKKVRKPDARNATLDTDPEYIKFVESLEDPEPDSIPPPESFLEEIEARDRELKANHGVLKMTTPLIDYILRRKEDRKLAIQRVKEDRKRKELEKKRQKEDEKRKRRERERIKERDRLREEHERAKRKSENSPSNAQRVLLLKNPEREKDTAKYVSKRSDGQEREVKAPWSDPKGKSPTKSDVKGKLVREKEWPRSSDKFLEKTAGRRESPARTDEKYSSGDSQSRSSDLTSRIRDPKIARDQRKYSRDPRDIPDRFNKDPRDDRSSKHAQDDRDVGESRRGRYPNDDRGSKERDQKEERPMRYPRDDRASYNQRDDGKKTRDERDQKDDQDQREGGLKNPRIKETISAASDKGKPKLESGRSSKEGSPVTLDTDERKEGSGRLSEEKQDGGDDSEARRQRVRYKDRPERAIYNPARRAAERRKEAEAKAKGEGDTS